MKTILPSMVKEIDRFMIETQGVSEEELIRRAGEAAADVIVEEFLTTPAAFEQPIVIFCGPGNNGADGYATGLSLMARGARVAAVDVFGKGQRSEGGKAVLEEFLKKAGKPLSLSEILKDPISGIGVDAVFGAGFSGEGLPEEGRIASRYMNRFCKARVAIDMPFGVDAVHGAVLEEPLSVDVTVVLGFMKRGLLSYPAREYCGKLLLKEIGLRTPALVAAIPMADEMPDDDYVRAHIPPRLANSHKGTYGKLAIIAGSSRFRGAAQLATLGALRSGVGLLSLWSESLVLNSMSKKLPEVIYKAVPKASEWDEAFYDAALAETKTSDAVLLGPGSGQSEALYRLVLLLLAEEGCPLVLDADAINVLAAHREEGLVALKAAKRPVMLTPHPLEFARLSGISLAEVQACRLRYAVAFAEECGVSLVLKGAGSVIASRGRVSVNTTGSSALSKGGSGDVLAGVAASFAAQGADPHDALTLAAYLHGKAGESLAKEVSEYGVLPSDLPRQIAMEIAQILG